VFNEAIWLHGSRTAFNLEPCLDQHTEQAGLHATLPLVFCAMIFLLWCSFSLVSWTVSYSGA